MQELIKEIEELESITYHKIFKDFCYAQSWIDDSIESDALWRIYSKGKGVRICINREILIQKIKNTLFKNLDLEDIDVHSLSIEYTNSPPLLINRSNFSNKCSIFKQIAGFKRIPFKHENEYRIGIILPIDQNKSFIQIQQRITELRSKNDISEVLDSITENIKLLTLKPDGFPVHIDLQIELDDIEEVILDSRAPEYHKKTFSSYCENRQFKKHNIMYGISTLY